MKKSVWLFLLLSALPFLGPRANAQGGITVSFLNAPSGNVFLAGGDYATDVFGNPWDMESLNDISIAPDERRDWGSLTFRSDTGVPTAVGGRLNGPEGLSVLYKGHYGVINNVRHGRRFPIDTTVYRRISFKMKTQTADIPFVWWFHRPYSDPGGQGIGGAWNFTGTTPNVYQVATVDLGAPPNQTGETWTASNVVGLRIDPRGGATPTPEDVFFDWVRLTAADDAPGSAMQTVQWSGGTGNATVTVTDSEGTVFTIPCAFSTSTSCRWNYGILPPGIYTVTVTRDGSPGLTGQATFRINNPPSVQVTTPSTTSGEDYATARLGNPWNMDDAADIDNDVVGNADHLLSRSFPATEFVGVSDGVCVSNCGTAQPHGDPQVYMLANNQANNRGSIESTKYRYLTFTLTLDRAYNLFLGSVARIMWGHATAVDPTRGNLEPTYNLAVTEDMIVWPGTNTYTVDLASLAIGTDLGILPAPFSPTPTVWTSAAVRQLRIDPHEFAEQVTFRMSNVKVTAMSQVAPGGTFAIAFAASDADADSTSVRLFRDSDNNAANGGLTEITTSPLTSGSSFDWNTSGVPTGAYYIYAQISDSRGDTRGSYSSGPVGVQTPTAGPPNPAMGLDAPGNGTTVGTTFNVSGWAIDRGAASGTGVDTVHVYVFPSGSGTPVFVQAATYGSARTDIGSIFGSQFTNSGFSLSVSGISPGNYQVTAFGRSTVSNTFSMARSANITVSGPQSQPVLSLDGPQSNSTVGRTVTVAGWAVDLGSTSGTGVDTIHIYAFPASGPAQFLGSATYGIARPDIGAALGSRFTNSGYRLTAVVEPAGVYTIAAYARSTVAGTFNAGVAATNVTVQSSNTNAVLFVDTPGQNTSPTRPFTVSGWAVDSGSTSGTGIDAIHVWAFPTNGAAATFVGVAISGTSRPDIGSLFGDARFDNSGFTFTVNSANLAAGSYDLIVFGRSTVTNGFTVARVVRLNVQ